MSRREWNTYLAQISYMFQNNALFDSKTVYQNVAMPLRKFNQLSKSQVHKKVMARLEQTELTDVADQYPSELSGGMQKRAALARALVTDPKIVLFDELTTGQDPIRRNAILGMIAEYKMKFGFTAVLISHDIPDVFFISNRILALYDKKIVFQGTPEAFEEFDHPFYDEIIASLEDLQHAIKPIWPAKMETANLQLSFSPLKIWIALLKNWVTQRLRAAFEPWGITSINTLARSGDFQCGAESTNSVPYCRFPIWMKPSAF
jgi:phospholipid/cholesterol/gamma-HCH transport system ATP-binding protein